MSIGPTPGPWTYDPETRQVTAEDEDGHDLMICEVTDTSEGFEGDCPAADANGRLIASAPAMRSLLERFDKLDTDPHVTDAEWSQFRRDVHEVFACVKGDQP